jgi:hypothetical protein
VIITDEHGYIGKHAGQGLDSSRRDLLNFGLEESTRQQELAA